MSILTIILGFAGGFFGAAFGSIVAFVFTGVFALLGSTLTIFGVENALVGSVAFGNFFGPHISFAAGAAAATYAAKRKKLENPLDILSALYGTNDLQTLLVGGVYGIIGVIVFTLMCNQKFIITDNPGFSVCVVLFINRLLLGKTPLVRKFEIDKEKITLNAINGFVTALGVCIVGKILLESGISTENMSIYPVFVFSISAISLLFLQMGFAVPVTHHITYPAATAFIMTQNIYIVGAVGLINAVLWTLASEFFNKDADTYIDPPAFVIVVSIFVINLIF